jgi:predicted  nucleic acid-binding Zn-ribbon protein
MPYCNQCGNELKGNEQFCGKCGAKQGEQLADNPVAVKQADIPPVPPPPAPGPVNQYTQPQKGKGAWKFIVMAVLAAALITVGVLYGMESSNLKQARTDIAGLENNVASLQTQLTAEQANAAALQTQLTATINDLNASRDEVAQLEDDLSASEQHIADLQTELDAANAELAQAYTEIAGLTDANTALSEELNMVKDPRHFNSLDELETWLENDDTDTNDAYSSLTPQGRAYVLQVKALRDGYLLSACIDWDSNYIYSWNIAVIGKAIYSINAETDVITAGPSFSDALPLHPLPLS